MVPRMILECHQSGTFLPVTSYAAGDRTAFEQGIVDYDIRPMNNLEKLRIALKALNDAAYDAARSAAKMGDEQMAADLRALALKSDDLVDRMPSGEVA